MCFVSLGRFGILRSKLAMRGLLRGWLFCMIISPWKFPLNALLMLCELSSFENVPSSVGPRRALDHEVFVI